MRPRKPAGLFLTLLAGLVLGSRPTAAQYTADFQTNIISGVTSNWTDVYYVGYTNFADVLLIQDNGILSNANAFGYIGYNVGSSNNSVLVSGGGAVWMTPGGGPFVGNSGAGNNMVISNGGLVVGLRASVGSGASSSNNSVLVTGAGSVWTNDGALKIGNSGCANTLIISDGGQVIGGDPSFIGYGASSNNFVSVNGVGSVWSNNIALYIGYLGNGNSLVISNGGQVASGSASIGGSTGGIGSWSNSALVTGIGSVWSNSGTLSIGPSKESNNNLVIGDGGKVLSAYGLLASPSNCVFVTGTGSVWSNQNDLSIGGYGTGNSLVISNAGQIVVGGLSAIGGNTGQGNHAAVLDNGVWQNGAMTIGNIRSSNSLTVADGSVLATNLVVGVATPDCGNLLQLDRGTVIVTNAAGDATLEVRWGTLILNGGTLQVDRFVMTNACAQFLRTGGTLIYSTAVLDPSRDDDGDGLSNGYEQSHGLDPLNADANEDSDGDGMSNLEEFQAGTDPTNNASVFRIVEIAPMDEDMLLTWTTVGGKKYAVQTATGDYTNNFIELAPVIIAPGSGESTLSVIHLGGATNGTARFYRIRLVP